MHQKELNAAFTAALAVSMAISAVTSCIDDRYDFTKDISADINVDVSLPVGSSEFIAIGDLLEIDGSTSGNTVTTDENGNYVIRFDGGNGLSINVPVPSFEFEAQALEKVEAGFSIPSAIVGLNPSQLQGDTYYEFPILTNGETPSMEMEVNAELPSEVVDLKNADVSSAIDFKFTIESGCLKLNKGLAITFPDFMTLEPDERSKDYVMIDEGHVVRLLQDLAINPDVKMASIGLHVSYIDLEKVPGHGIVTDGDARKLVLNDQVTVQGSVGLDAMDFNPVPSLVRMCMYIEMKTVLVERIEAKLNISEVFESQSIEFTDIPDFLSGDNVRLDLWNPLIWLDIDNGTPFSAELNADLRAISSNVQKASIHIGADGPENNRTAPVILPDGKGMIYISRQGYSSGTSGDADIVVPGLSELFETIPDTVVIDNMSVATDKDKYMILELDGTGYSNTVEARYGIDAPLAFGRGMSLLYTTDIKGWNDAFADGEDEDKSDFSIGLRQVDVDFTLMNTIPLNVEMDAVPVDVNGDEIISSGIEVSMEGTAEAGTEENPAYTPVKIVLTADSKAIKLLDGIRLTIYLTGSDKTGIEGHVLNERHGIQILDMSAKVSGTVSVNLPIVNNEDKD